MLIHSNGCIRIELPLVHSSTFWRRPRASPRPSVNPSPVIPCPLADIDGEAAGDEFGHNLALSEDGLILAVYAMYNDGVNGVDSGHVRVYRLDAGPSPTSQPTTQPSITPSNQPTTQPSVAPSSTPTTQPSVAPSSEPSHTPSTQPTTDPTAQPSTDPTAEPTAEPTLEPICFNSYQTIVDVCAGYSEADINMRIVGTDDCYVKVMHATTCIPAESLTCSSSADSSSGD